MKEIVPSDSRYIPLVQQRSCCVPTSILIVMYKLGIPLISQELLGHHLGLIVDAERGKFFWNPRMGEKPPAGYGTRIYLKEYNPDLVFEKLKISLKSIFYPIDKFEDRQSFIDFVSKAIEEERDLLVRFNHGVLKGEESGGGHTCVVDRIFPSQNIIRLIDPSPSQPKWREVNIDQLKDAMERHPNGGGSFWELKTKKQY